MPKSCTKTPRKTARPSPASCPGAPELFENLSEEDARNRIKEIIEQKKDENQITGNREEITQQIVSNLKQADRRQRQQLFNHRDISRRDFLKLLGMSAGTIGLVSGASGAWGQLRASSQGVSDVNADEVDGHHLSVGSSRPSNVAGTLFYDTNDQKVEYYNGSSWIEIANAGLAIPDLVARWPMDQSLNDVYNSYHLQEDGATASYTSSNKEGTHALTANESGGPKFSTADSTIWDPVESANQMTICGWALNDHDDNNWSSWAGSKQSTNQVRCGVNQDSSYSLYFQVGGIGSASYGSGLSTGSWYFVAFRVDAPGNTIDVRLGESTVASSSTSSSTLSGFDTSFRLACVGGADGNNVTWDGDWDDVRLYSRYLSDSELNDIKNNATV